MTDLLVTVVGFFVGYVLVVGAWYERRLQQRPEPPPRDCPRDYFDWCTGPLGDGLRCSGCRDAGNAYRVSRHGTGDLFWSVVWPVDAIHAAVRRTFRVGRQLTEGRKYPLPTDSE